MSTQFSSIWPINRTLSGATIPGQSEPGSDGNKGVLRIPQSSSITGASPSDCLVSYLGHSLSGVLPLYREAVGVFYSPSRLGYQDTHWWVGGWGSYHSAEKESMHSTAPAYWTRILTWNYNYLLMDTNIYIFYTFDSSLSHSSLSQLATHSSRQRFHSHSPFFPAELQTFHRRLFKTRSQKWESAKIHSLP